MQRELPVRFGLSEGTFNCRRWRWVLLVGQRVDSDSAFECGRLVPSAPDGSELLEWSGREKLR